MFWCDSTHFNTVLSYTTHYIFTELTRHLAIPCNTGGLNLFLCKAVLCCTCCALPRFAMHAAQCHSCVTVTLVKLLLAVELPPGKTSSMLITWVHMGTGTGAVEQPGGCCWGAPALSNGQYSRQTSSSSHTQSSAS